MERVKLSKNAKIVLRLLEQGHNLCPKGMNYADFNRGALELRRNDFALCHQEENGNVEAAQLTELGTLYIAENPSLSNPVNWTAISMIIGGITAICSIFALFIACNKL